MRGFALLLGFLLLAGCASQVDTTATSPFSAGPRAQTPQPVVANSPTGSGEVWPADAPFTHARCAIMIDARTGRTLYQKYADNRQQVASTQKLLTALVVTENTDINGRVVIASSDTYVEPGKLYVRAGQSYSRLQLLTAMMVKSENDAAAALGRDHSGSIEAFAADMNRMAWSLGARSSHFVNPHGLPANQYSTARDMARIAFRAYHEPLLRRLMNTQFYTFTYADGRSRTLETTNKLLRRSPMFNGMKTGYTVAAGRCLVSSAASGGREVILVQLGSRTNYIFNDAEIMMRWGLEQASPSLFAAR